MKRMFNLLSEVLSLPFSELFISNDILAFHIDEAMRKAKTLSDLETDLCKRIDEMAKDVAGYVDLHTSIHNISELQNLINYIFDGEAIARLAWANKAQLRNGVQAANYYYFSLLTRIAKTFITNRDGKAAFKFFPGVQPTGDDPLMEMWFHDILGSGFESNRIEAWHSLLQCLPPEIMLCAYCASLVLTNDTPDERQSCFHILHQFGPTIHISDAILDHVLERGMAETHLHASASRSFDEIWEKTVSTALADGRILKGDYTQIFSKSVSEKDMRLWHREAGTIRILLAGFLRSNRTNLMEYLNTSLFHAYGSKFQIIVLDLISLGRTNLFFSDLPCPSLVLNLSSKLQDAGLGQILDLPDSITCPDPGFAERLFMSWSILHIYLHPGDVGFTAVFLYYLRIKNQVYRFRIQDSKSTGLDYFQCFFRQSTDSTGLTANQRMRAIIASAIRDRRVQKVELRFSIPFPQSIISSEYLQRATESNLATQIRLLIGEHLGAIIDLYGTSPRTGKNNLDSFDEYVRKWASSVRSVVMGKKNVLSDFLRSNGVDLSRVAPHRLGVMYHFIKSGEKREERSCFASFNPTAPLDGSAVFSFGTSRYYSNVAVEALTSLRRHCPELSRLIVGIDAASLELPTEPWVFAPAFRRARDLDSYPGYGADGNGAKALLGFTYHVGEEFHHPLSGLRHIFETVSEYRFHAGDRLGHALALGIDIPQWFSSHRLIAMPCGEWMDDCLWAWSVISGDASTTESSKYVKFLEQQIISCAERIYGGLNGITIHKLYRSYKNKAMDNCEIAALAPKWRISHQAKPLDCVARKNKHLFFPCVKQDNDSTGGWWDEDSLTLSNHCDFYKHEMVRELLREPSNEEILLTTHLQAYLKRFIAQKGIIIEENPSSNTTIGEFGGILDHPMYDLRIGNQDSSKIMASINTDDPSVFNSSIANEHGLIYFALLNKGLSTEDAIKVVDELRSIGMSSSFVPAPEPFSALLEEYERIIRYLSKWSENLEVLYG